MNTRQQSSTIELSVRVYCALLRLYPTKHRQEYGWLMAQAFRDKAYAVYRGEGGAGMVLYWLGCLLDLVVSVIQERREKEYVTVSDSNIVKFNPYLLMIGGALLAFSGISQLQPDDHYTFYGIYAVSFMGLPGGLIALAAGLYGLGRSFKGEFGWLGKWGTLLGSVGGIAPFLAIVVVFIMSSVDAVWYVGMTGVAALFASFILVGIDVLRQKMFPRWAGLLMIVSGITPFIALPLDPVDVGVRYISFAGIVLVGGCWVLIGNYLRQYPHEQLTANPASAAARR